MSVTRGAGRPTSGYRLADNTRVPSVTTITGRFKDSGGLIRWAYRCGQDGIDMDAKRDAAADAGSIAHQWIEDALHGDPPTTFPEANDALIAAALAGFGAYKEWAGMVSLEIVETEVPLVSEEHRYGGTLDAVAVINGEASLLDWKTSGGAYPDYIAQVAAYRQLLRERDGDAAPQRAMLLRLGKEHADFHFHLYPSSVLDMGWDWFLRAREMYDLDKGLKRVAA